jgi:hypothetical protein
MLCQFGLDSDLKARLRAHYIYHSIADTVYVVDGVVGKKAACCLGGTDSIPGQTYHKSAKGVSFH